MIYIKATLPGEEGGYIDTAENAKKIIDELISAAEDGDMELSYEFKAVEMSETDFDALPRFGGF